MFKWKVNPAVGDSPVAVDRHSISDDDDGDVAVVVDDDDGNRSGDAASDSGGVVVEKRADGSVVVKSAAAAAAKSVVCSGDRTNADEVKRNKPSSKIRSRFSFLSPHAPPVVRKVASAAKSSASVKTAATDQKDGGRSKRNDDHKKKKKKTSMTDPDDTASPSSTTKATSQPLLETRREVVHYDDAGRFLNRRLVSGHNSEPQHGHQYHQQRMTSSTVLPADDNSIIIYGAGPADVAVNSVTTPSQRSGASGGGVDAAVAAAVAPRIHCITDELKMLFNENVRRRQLEQMQHQPHHHSRSSSNADSVAEPHIASLNSSSNASFGSGQHQHQSSQEGHHNQKSNENIQAWTQQLHAYTAWVNSQLRKRPGCAPVTDLRLDLRSGHVLADLVEILSGEQLSCIERQPTTTHAMRENVERVLRFMAATRIRMHYIAASDVVAGDLKSIMRLVLALAAYYKPHSVKHQQTTTATPLNETNVASGIATALANVVARPGAEVANRKIPESYGHSEGNDIYAVVNRNARSANTRSRQLTQAVATTIADRVPARNGPTCRRFGLSVASASNIVDDGKSVRFGYALDNGKMTHMNGSRSTDNLPGVHTDSSDKNVSATAAVRRHTPPAKCENGNGNTSGGGDDPVNIRRRARQALDFWHHLVRTTSTTPAAAGTTSSSSVATHIDGGEGGGMRTATSHDDSMLHLYDSTAQHATANRLAGGGDETVIKYNTIHRMSSRKRSDVEDTLAVTHVSTHLTEGDAKLSGVEIDSSGNRNRGGGVECTMVDDGDSGHSSDGGGTKSTPSNPLSSASASEDSRSDRSVGSCCGIDVQLETDANTEAGCDRDRDGGGAKSGGAVTVHDLLHPPRLGVRPCSFDVKVGGQPGAAEAATVQPIMTAAASYVDGEEQQQRQRPNAVSDDVSQIRRQAERLYTLLNDDTQSSDAIVNRRKTCRRLPDLTQMPPTSSHHSPSGPHSDLRRPSPTQAAVRSASVSRARSENDALRAIVLRLQSSLDTVHTAQRQLSDENADLRRRLHQHQQQQQLRPQRHGDAAAPVPSVAVPTTVDMSTTKQLSAQQRMVAINKVASTATDEIIIVEDDIGIVGPVGHPVSGNSNKASQLRERSSSKSADAKVIYFTSHQAKVPFMTTVTGKPAGTVTLADLKAHLFNRHQQQQCGPLPARFHFQTTDREFGTVKEEITDDAELLPVNADGKIVAWFDS